MLGSWGGSAVELGEGSDPIPPMQVLEGELQSEATRQQERVAELQEQLAQKEQAAEHYKAQVSCCKLSPSLRSVRNLDSLLIFLLLLLLLRWKRQKLTMMQRSSRTRTWQRS